MGRSIRIIIHGRRAGTPELREAVDRLRAEGHSADIRATQQAGDAIRLAAEATGDGIDSVVAAGGDGTLNEVVAGLLSVRADPAARPALGVLPLGTANDFARACDVPEDLHQALRLVVDTVPRPVDAGRVNDRSFVNVTTAGFGTRITVDTPDDLKDLFGHMAYLITGLANIHRLEAVPSRVQGPGLSWDGDLLLLAVGNGRQAGGGHVLCPNAALDDGLFDVTLMPALSPEELPDVLRALLSEGASAVTGVAVTARVPHLTLDTPHPVYVNADGEPLESRRFRFEILPGALRMHLPASAPLRTP